MATQRGVVVVLLLVVVAHPVWAQKPKFNPNAKLEDFFDNKPKSCPAKRCGEGEEPAPTRPLKLTSKGSCAGMGMGMSVLSKQQDDVLNPCCDARQACDQTCGTTLRLCDEAFDKCAAQTCATAPDPESCSKDANIHKLMVSIGDPCQSFVPSQNIGCECLPGETARGRRKQLLKDLYAKHAPETPADKVDSLAAKSIDTPKKFATLILKLIAKYPKIVSVLGQDDQDWAKMFADAQQRPGAKFDHVKRSPPVVKKNEELDLDDDDDSDVINLDSPAPPGDEL